METWFRSSLEDILAICKDIAENPKPGRHTNACYQALFGPLEHIRRVALINKSVRSKQDAQQFWKWAILAPEAQFPDNDSVAPAMLPSAIEGRQQVVAHVTKPTTSEAMQKEALAFAQRLIRVCNHMLLKQDAAA